MRFLLPIDLFHAATVLNNCELTEQHEISYSLVLTQIPYSGLFSSAQKINTVTVEPQNAEVSLENQ